MYFRSNISVTLLDIDSECLIFKKLLQRISKKKSVYHSSAHLKLVQCMTTTRGQHCSAPSRHRLKYISKCGLLGLMPCGRRRLRTVCELVLRNPGIPAAVVDAAAVRFRRWKTQMYRSCPGVVMRGLPLLWRSFVEPVCWNLFHRLEMVLWLTFRVRVTSCRDSPAWRRPIAIFRVAGSNLGMTAYQLSNTSQASNLVLLYALGWQLN